MTTTIQNDSVWVSPAMTRPEGERCRNSLHSHGTPPVTSEGGGLLDWEAERFLRAADRLGLDPALTCALHCANR